MAKINVAMYGKADNNPFLKVKLKNTYSTNMMNKNLKKKY